MNHNALALPAPFNGVNQFFRRHAAHFILWLIDGRHARIKRQAYINAVVTDDGHISGHAHVPFQALAQHAQRHHVVFTVERRRHALHAGDALHAASAAEKRRIEGGRCASV